tara:strand:+ start:1548 stop:1781 length:234 start_codon:yes stop_codon:yes gene_type:complete
MYHRTDNQPFQYDYSQNTLTLAAKAEKDSATAWQPVDYRQAIAHGHQLRGQAMREMLRTFWRALTARGHATGHGHRA